MGVEEDWEEKTLKCGKSQKIRTLPTRPLHAVLDELLAIGITFWIIVLNHRAVLCFGKEGSHPRGIWKPGRQAETGKTEAQVESTHPENGQEKRRVVRQRQISMNGILRARKQV